MSFLKLNNIFYLPKLLKNNNFHIVLLFIFFLYPIKYSFNLDADNSPDHTYVNYSFLLYILYKLVNDKKIYTSNNFLNYSILFFIFLLIYSFIDEQVNNLNNNNLRRIISFILFVSFFLFAFLKIEKKEIENLKISIVLLSLILIINKFIIILSLENAISNWQGYNWKHIIGSQRLGFIYILSYWIFFFEHKKLLNYLNIKDYKNFIRNFFLLIILIGIYFTISRSAYFAFLITIIVFIYLNYTYYAKLLFFSVAVCLSLILIFYFTNYGPDIINYYIKLNLEADTSIGYRFYIWKKIIIIVFKNPLVGNGYVGVASMEGGSGSAHSQYFDVLFRVGIIGFIIYFFTIYKILKFYKKKDLSIFLGLISFLIIGIFHETIKLSHGSCIVGFLLGYMVTSNRSLILK
jgi:O-antigen ligase